MSGLDMENSAPNFPEEQLQEMFPESNGDTGCERFDPAYFLLEEEGVRQQSGHQVQHQQHHGPVEHPALCQVT